MGKRRRDPTDSSSSESEEVYQVEVIKSARVRSKPKAKGSSDNDWEYLVKWAGYNSDANSWEPAKNVKDCDRLLRSFWDHVGFDSKDYLPGHQIDAEESWIQEEKAFFARQISEQNESKRKRKEEREVKRKLEAAEKQKPKKKARGTESTLPSVASSSKLKIVLKKTPLTSKIPDTAAADESSVGTPALAKKRISKKRIARVESSSDDSSDTPVATKQKRTVVSKAGPTSDKGKQKAVAPPEEPSSPDVPRSLFSESPPSSPGIPLASKSLANKPLPPPPRLKVVPTLPPRVQNVPRPPTFPPRQNTTTSGISTKQRLAEKALMPIRPGITRPSIAIPTPRNLSSLRINKTPSAVTPKSATGPNHDAKPQLPPQRNVSTSSISAISPTIPSASTKTQSYSQSISRPGLKSNLTAEADDFLNKIMPPALAAPLQPTVERRDGPMPPIFLPRTKPTALPRIPKKWKWSGGLSLASGEGQSEVLCDATIIDVTESAGFRLSIAMSEIACILVDKLYSGADIDTLLLACKPLHQFGKLLPQDAKDADTLKTFASYMSKTHQFAFVPLPEDSVIPGFIFVFPSADRDLCFRFRVPLDLPQPDSFVVALGSWLIPPAVQTYEWRTPPGPDRHIDTTYSTPTLDVDRWGRTIRTTSHYQHALRVLQFPKWLHDIMSQPNQAYCVWWDSGDGTKDEPGLETKLLHEIMEECRAKDVGYKADVQAVFVHVGALKTIHMLTALPERRYKRAELCFYTYGTHETVPREYWGIHGIFPIGGVVTFTPSAFIEDPIGAMQRIKLIAEHPLWTCYIIPQVLGMLAKMTGNDADPLFRSDKGKFPYDFLLEGLESGDISLLQSPPLGRNARRDKDPIRQWMDETLTTLHPLDGQGYLEYCINICRAQYANVEPGQWASAIEADISKDLSAMQMQPIVMRTWRRFVVIRGVNDKHIAWNRDGFEWVSASEFDFKDAVMTKVRRKPS